MNDIDYMNECTIRDLAIMLMEDYEISLPDALERVYNSETFQKLQDASTGLYYQSPVYIYDYLKEELTTGKM